MFKRGEVYTLKLPKNEGNVQGGTRPVVILSNDKSNDNSTIIHFAPLTSKLKKLNLPVHIIVNNQILEETSMVLCEQMDKMTQDEFSSLVKNKKGKLSDEDMIKISYGAAAQLGFSFLLKPTFYNKVIKQ